MAADPLRRPHREVNRTSAAARVLRWYEREQRALPWRTRRDPYAVWVSEVMLQQTQVDRVRPFFERFIERFPTVEALAQAAEEEVLAAWTGLGYYRRARQLHQGAAAVVAAGGSFPRDADGLRRLPGVGEYTAAAIASIAYGQAVPALDANVERVISRYLAFPDPPRRVASRRALTAAAAELLDPACPGASNQALMELGALVCRPKRPRCARCPLADDCQGLAEGAPERYPLGARRLRRERCRWTVVVVESDEGVLLFRRAAEEIFLAGLWELPWVEAEGEPGSEGEVEATLGQRYGGDWELRGAPRAIRHSITYRDIAVAARRGRWRVAGSGNSSGPRREARWQRREHLDRLGLSSLVGKVLAEVPSE